MITKEIKVTGQKELGIALALIDAGGNDQIRPPQEILEKALAQFGEGEGLAISVIDGSWVALRGRNRGLTIYHFYCPVKLV